MKQLLTKAFLILAIGTVEAQTNSVANKNLTWYSSLSTEHHSNTELNVEARIVVKSNRTVDLIIQEQPIQFSILSISGTWASETQDGKLLYSLRYNESSAGEMRIKRMTGKTVVSFDFTGSDPNGIKWDFTISSVENN